MIKRILRPYIWKFKDLFEDKKERLEGFKNEVSYVNWWAAPEQEIQWFTKFIEYHIGYDLSKHITFYSVMGPYRFLKERNTGIKIFFTGENVIQHKLYTTLKENKYRAQKFVRRRYLDFGKCGLGDVDIALGYIDINNDKYIRFPLWILRLFSPDSNYDDIKNRIRDINLIKNRFTRNKAVAINGHDYFGTRTKICDDIKDIIDIVYAGKWRNNTKELWEEYNNDKLKYIQEFKFNICAENMDAPQYVTEKLFECLLSGTIPIYHGAFNNPEPNIINRDRVIFWNFDSDNEENRKLLNKLVRDDNFYYKFVAQKKVYEDYMAEFVYTQMQKLKNKILILLK